jgi:nitrogen-specific signal transduction histidine kinase
VIIDLSSIVPALTFLLYVIFLVFGILNNQTGRVGRSIFLYLGSMTVWSFGSFMMHANTGLLTPLIWNRVMVVGLFAVPITLFNALVNLTTSHTRYRKVLLILGYSIYPFLLLLNFRGLIVSDAGYHGSVFFYQLGSLAPLAYVILYTYLVLCVIVISLEIRKYKDPLNRKKLTPLLIGAVVLVAGQLANIDESIGRYPIDLAAASLNGLLIFYSIYKYRLVYYSRTVLKILVYFVLLLSLASLFSLVIWLAANFGRIIAFPRIFLFSVTLAILSAVVFQPIRRGALWTIGQLYSGKRLSYYQSLKAYSESLTTLVDLETLVAAVSEKILTTFEPAKVAIFVLDYGDRQYHMLSLRGGGVPDGFGGTLQIPQNDGWWTSGSGDSGTSRFRETDALPLEVSGSGIILTPRLMIPLRFRDRTNGYIVLERPKKKDYYDQLALETLEIFAGQCSIAVENAISFERLRNQQKRLQTMNSELLISRNKLEALFDGITAPISLQDINYNIVLINKAAARFFGKPERDIVRRKCYQMYFGRSLPCQGCPAQDCLHTQLPFSIDMVHEPTRTSFSTHFYPVSVPEDTGKMFLEFFHDVTEQKSLREELLQSAKLAGIGTLASGIAHEINNPLMAITATADVILELPGIDDRVRDYTGDIMKCARHAAAIISDLNAYSRRDPAEKTEVDLVDVIDAALKMALRGMSSPGIEVRTSFREQPLVRGSTNELQQVFLNLIINGMQAMHGAGSLDLVVDVQDGHVIAEVTDSGEGIPPEMINEIFNPFFTTKEPGEGTGLGLSIVHQILNRHGGRIYASSLPGVSTTMRVLLPLATADPPVIHFVQVRNDRDLEDVFYLQRKILVGERGYHSETIHRPTDTRGFHILAYKGFQPIGTVTCFVDENLAQLPIASHLALPDLQNAGTIAEVDRLAVVAEERGGMAPVGLMMLAYLYSRSRGAGLVLLDIFSDDRQKLNLYRKLGFEEVGTYNDPSEFTVMVLRHKLNYETDSRRLNSFLKPLLGRLIPRIDFEPQVREMLLEQARPILDGPKPQG